MPSINMTAQWVERLKPPLKRTDYFDAKLKGLGLRASPTGNKVWFVMYRVKGDPTKRRLTLDGYPVLSLADAREAAQATVISARRGFDPGREKQELRTAPTFSDLAVEYIEKYAKKNKRSWKEDARIIRHDLNPKWGKRKAHDIKRRDVIYLLDAIVERGSPIQANRVLALVRKVYNWAISRDIVEFNPCLQVKAPAKEHQRDRVLGEDEIRSLWEAFESQDVHVGSMLKLRLLTAQRGGEIASMEWSDIDLVNAWWTIPADKSKNELSHRVPLSGPSIEILANLKRCAGDSSWVFPSPTSSGRHIENVQKAAQRVRKAADVDNFVLHDLRRTAASYMTSYGISRLVVSKILNHVEQGVTRVYDRHSYDREKRAALDLWAEKLHAILKGGSTSAEVVSLQRYGI